MNSDKDYAKLHARPAQHQPQPTELFYAKQNGSIGKLSKPPNKKTPREDAPAFLESLPSCHCGRTASYFPFPLQGRLAYLEAGKRNRISANVLGKNETQPVYSPTHHLPDHHPSTGRTTCSLHDRGTPRTNQAQIKLLQNNKAPGLDGIENELLKCLPEAWVQVLKIYNQLFQDC